MQATQKQINFALALMDKAGYSTRFMNRGHKALGATMRQRSGSVRDWLASMSRSEVSALIDQLKAETTAEPVAAAEAALVSSNIVAAREPREIGVDQATFAFMC